MADATRTHEILDRALEIVKTTPYPVSLRWIFYELLQQGFYNTKKGYLAWKALCSRYRKNFARGWHPATLADDTRARITRAWGDQSIGVCLAHLIKDVVAGVDFHLDHFYQQSYYVEVWFEARGMAGQFKYHTQGIDLVPFGGDPSIPLKWDTAKALEDAQRYGKDIVVLYFGDYDVKGLEIIESAVNDIRVWCATDFEVVRCGLTPAQIEHYNIPENPARPGEYQWEALSKRAAEEIILSSLSKHLNLERISEVDEEAESEELDWKARVHAAMKRLVKKHG